MSPDIAAWENEGGVPRPNYEFAGWKNISVTIYDQSGRPFSFKAFAPDFDSAVRSARSWFQRQEGIHPKPNRDTVYELSISTDVRKWRVCGGTVQTMRSVSAQ
jgi:hypothetical protein